MEITLNEKQSKAFKSTAKEVHFIGGVGSGKTFIIGVKTYLNTLVPGCLQLLAAPTYDTMRTTLNQVQDAWSKLGLVDGRDYVINERPPEDWRVQPYSKISSNRIITFRWGSYILCETLDNFNKIRGTEFDEIFVDEFRDVKEGAREVLVGRLRGKSYRDQGKKHKIWFCTTPPNDPTAYQELISRADGMDIEFIYSTTFENAHNLPDDYIETMRQAYDSETFRREVLGEFVAINDRPFLFAFDLSQHVKPGLEVNENLELWLSFDFNKDPITCIAGQTSGDHTHVLHEFEMENGDIIELCKRIKTTYPDYYYMITGDATGKNRSVALPGNMNNYKIIQQELEVPQKRFRVRGKNLPISESRALCNAVLERHPDHKVDESCKGLIRDLQNSRTGNKGELVKDRKSNKNDYLDCYRYLVDALHFDWLKK